MRAPLLAVAAARFIRAADALVNAQDRLQKHAPGSKGRAKAMPVWQAADFAYEAAKAELEGQLREIRISPQRA